MKVSKCCGAEVKESVIGNRCGSCKARCEVMDKPEIIKGDHETLDAIYNSIPAGDFEKYDKLIREKAITEFKQALIKRAQSLYLSTKTHVGASMADIVFVSDIESVAKNMMEEK